MERDEGRGRGWVVLGGYVERDERRRGWVVPCREG